VRCEPALLNVERWRNRKDVRILGFQEMRQTFLRNQKGAARIDAIDQILALHRRVENCLKAHGARIIQADIDAAEPGNGRGNRRLNLFLVADIADKRLRFSAGFSISCGADAIVPGKDGCGSDVLAAMAMLAPSQAARSAMARPIPREPPLIKIVLPASVLLIANPRVTSSFAVSASGGVNSRQ
jgi:hypothetical protein